MPHIAYYITGHGLGHASRSILVVKHLLERGCTVDVITTVQATFFEKQIDQKFAQRLTIRDRILDGGAVQNGPLSVDGVSTLERYQTIHLSRESLENGEIGYLKDSNIDIVISDATPIACSAGRKAGCKVIILSNFTWDWIYREILEEVKNQLSDEQAHQYGIMIDQCSADYSFADIYLQLPGVAPLPMGFIAERMRVGPLLAGHAGSLRASLRQSLGLSEEVHVLLLGFGGHQAQWRLKDSFLPDGWRCLVLGADEEDLPPGGRFQCLSFDCCVPDLVQAADAVLGKLGYGFMSECLSNGTPLVYVPRSCWPEEACLRVFMETCGACVLMHPQDFAEGRWAHSLASALEIKARMVNEQCSMKDINAVGKIVDTALSLLN